MKVSWCGSQRLKKRIGKGKLVDILAEKYDICGRFNGGANAG
jgi:hypothetical protein